MLLAAGEIHQREGILGVAHHPQVRLDAALEDDAGLGFALSTDAEHARLVREKSMISFGALRGHQEIDVADHFPVPANAAAGAAPNHFRVGPEHLQDRFGHHQRVAQQVARGVSTSKGDALQNLGLRLLAEALEASDFALLAGRFEGLDGVHAQVIVQGFDLLRAKPGDLQHGRQPRWHGSLELVVIMAGARW